MSDLDVAKEKIAYLKVWLAILVVTTISLIGWLVIEVAKIQTSNTETIVAFLVVGTALVFVWCALDAAKDRPPKDRASKDKGI